jgi:MFS transporter, PAT family, beta-lactamase induction signal transducer AmpG
MFETAAPHNPSTTATVRTWREALRLYLQPASLRMLSLGFSAGLPLLLVFGTLSFWLREAGVDRSTIGFLSWVGLAYGFKWVWSPLVDRMPIPVLTRLLGRRRSWLLLAQAGIMAGLVSMALTDPKLALAPMVWCAIAVASARPHKTLRWMHFASSLLTHSTKPHWPQPTRPATGWP